MTAETFEPITVGLPDERPLHVISMQLAKREAHATTTSMAMSWRAGCTQEEALGSAMLSATKQKPGFSVEQWLVYTFEATDHAR